MRFRLALAGLLLLLAACGGGDGRAPFVESRIPPALSPRFWAPDGWAWGLLKVGDAPAQRYGVSSTLIHMERVDVNTGESVAQGQRIGLLGAAGRASGPHVDWRMNWNGVRLDPALLVSPVPEN